MYTPRDGCGGGYIAGKGINGLVSYHRGNTVYDNIRCCICIAVCKVPAANSCRWPVFPRGSTTTAAARYYMHRGSPNPLNIITQPKTVIFLPPRPYPRARRFFHARIAPFTIRGRCCRCIIICNVVNTTRRYESALVRLATFTDYDKRHADMGNEDRGGKPTS